MTNKKKKKNGLKKPIKNQKNYILENKRLIKMKEKRTKSKGKGKGTSIAEHPIIVENN